MPPTLQNRISPDVFIHLHTNTTPNGSSDTHLIYLLPGNPGLCSYYHTFLTLLTQSSPAAAQFAIVGMSLPGFESAPDDLDWNDEDILFPDEIATKRSAKRRGDGGEKGWWGLEEVVEVTTARIDEVVRRLQAGLRGRKVRVTLMGHSLGTWLSLEVVRRVSERQRQQRGGNEREDDGSGEADEDDEPTEDSTGVLGVGKAGGKRKRTGSTGTDWEAEACVALAPTIIELAKSSSGVKVAPLLATFTFLPWLLQSLASGLTWASRREMIEWIVARFLGLSPNNPGVATTARFLQSPSAVRQSLELAKQELVSISKDDWGPEVWGTGPALQMGGLEQTQSPKLFFLFAQTDHWIADSTRDTILRGRARHDGHGAFVVDEKHGLKHAWCLEQNQAVVDYVKPWLEDIARRQ
ncbi:uncharacterized protein AB675_6013 [Cyphellophora attinorum]|uniref:AB hydrolase-1 domain-containing protein n=1 Tax=Cyphellophora attinorum TaxID=1664694 RepID=A0A0N0NJR9_9EURO|nr:uncharacterized protein AB675_6013 [Phialophora attinorum]KPI36969.1 hypothetical protein AB675_6013 [Phialophora attinorum]